MTNKEVIVGLLKDNSKGLSIEELSIKSELNRTTVRVILAELLGQKKITQRHIGQVKINYWDFGE